MCCLLLALHAADAAFADAQDFGGATQFNHFFDVGDFVSSTLTAPWSMNQLMRCITFTRKRGAVVLKPQRQR